MSRQQQITQLLEHYFSAVWIKAGMAWDSGNRAEIRELGEALSKPPVGWVQGVPGSGVCVCKFSPEAQEDWARRSGYASWLARDQKEGAGAAELDHRCPRHGNEAQPAVWGRHKTLTLQVTAKEWDSLGVRHVTAR